MLRLYIFGFIHVVQYSPVIKHEEYVKFYFPIYAIPHVTNLPTKLTLQINDITLRMERLFVLQFISKRLTDQGSVPDDELILSRF